MERLQTMQGGVLALALAVGAMCIGHVSRPPEGKSDDDSAPPSLASVVLPRFANGEVSVEDPASKIAARFALRDAREVAAGGTGDLVSYSAALQGNDVMHRVNAVGIEDYVLFARRPRDAELVYDIDVSRVAGLRLVSQTLELLDSQGTPRLRVAPPYVVDATGVRHDAGLALSGCNYDESPVEPWGRPITSSGASSCTLRVTWASDLEYPLLVDPAWTLTGSMIVPRQGHTASVLTSGKVFIAGGTTASGAPTASAEIYDPVTGTFAATKAMSTARTRHTASQINGGGILIAGGLGPDGALASAQVYSPVFGFYGSAGSDMTTARIAAAVIVLPSNEILFVGGEDSGANPLSSAELYEPTTGLFTATTAPMNATRSGPTVSLLATGKVLVVGGLGGAPLGAELFDPATGTFAVTGSVPRAGGDLAGHTATVLTTGKVLVAGGGLDGTGAELYDPGLGTFAATGALTTSRSSHTAVVLASGRVLLTGGTALTRTATAEIYDPKTATFAATGSMSKARSNHTASTLLSGRVLVAGGLTDGDVEDATSELLFGAIGGPCSQADMCSSGVCEEGTCCAVACQGTCKTCQKTTGACVTVTNADDPSSCTGTRTCDVAGVCGLKKGQRCDVSDACAHAPCVDGFCCDSPCDGACDSCALPGNEGTCSVVPAGSVGVREHYSCAPYLCDGKWGGCPGSCSRAGDCTDGNTCNVVTHRCVESGQTTCNDLVSSVDATGIGLKPCAPYICELKEGGGGRCRESCRHSGDCAPSSACDSTGRCVPAELVNPERVSASQGCSSVSSGASDGTGVLLLWSALALVRSRRRSSAALGAPARSGASTSRRGTP